MKIYGLDLIHIFLLLLSEFAFQYLIQSVNFLPANLSTEVVRIILTELKGFKAWNILSETSEI